MGEYADYEIDRYAFGGRGLRVQATQREQRLRGQAENPNRKIECACGRRFKEQAHYEQHWKVKRCTGRDIGLGPVRER